MTDKPPSAEPTIYLDLQLTTDDNDLPSENDFQLWVNTALKQYGKDFELTIRVVSLEESQQLNHQYRDKEKPTNVLSFPFDVPDGIELNLLGDLVICADIVRNEAAEQHKPLTSHWAHMVIHGCLHLLGFDHIDDDEADEMESIEISLLRQLSINNPYLEI